MIRLESVLDSWKAVRQDTAQAVEDFPAAEMDFKPTSDVMTPQFREMLQKYLAELPATQDAADLAAALRENLEMRAGQLASQNTEFFAHVITRFDGQRVTRLEMVQFTKEHELTHRAQLFLYLRLKGIVPATTRRRLAKQQRA
jgi:uncharacterized damage-inducible protein DinB